MTLKLARGTIIIGTSVRIHGTLTGPTIRTPLQARAVASRSESQLQTVYRGVRLFFCFFFFWKVASCDSIDPLALGEGFYYSIQKLDQVAVAFANRFKRVSKQNEFNATLQLVLFDAETVNKE